MIKFDQKEIKEFEEIFARYKDTIKFTEDEKLSFINHSFFYLDWLVFSKIKLKLSEKISIDSKKEIVVKAIRSTLRKNKFDGESFVSALNNKLSGHNKQPLRTFFLVDSISVKNLPFRKVTIGNSIIALYRKHIPFKFRKSRIEIFKKHSNRIENLEYTKVCVTVKAREYKDAYSQAFQDLEVFRSLLCLFLNPSLKISFGVSSDLPINRILRSEISTIHDENGKLTNESNYWYQQDFIAIEPFTIEESKKQLLKENLRFLVDKYNNCRPKHKSVLRDALNQYVRAFDEKNKYYCFLKSWSALEILTNSFKNELIISRSIALYDQKSKPFEKEVMNCLCRYRNESVHQGKDGHDPHIACFLIQKILKNIFFKFNLTFAGFFDNIEQANLYLDNYTPELGELKKKRDILNKIIRRKEIIGGNSD